ncbi:MAG: hypothetical protein J6K17_09640 [Oscillospiraceae bacterium]|nr:hypothetical protein [Oscillospiraceae bacterium]
MRRNVLLTNTAIENNSMIGEKSEPNIEIPTDCLDEFVTAMKIGYYKEFYKQGLITSEQLEQLISMQGKLSVEKAA